MYNCIWCSALVVLAVVVLSALISWPSSTQPQRAQPLQNTICRNTQSCSPEDGHNDARNMLRQKFDNKHQISCILLVSLSSPHVHDARSQEPKITLSVCSSESGSTFHADALGLNCHCWE